MLSLFDALRPYLKESGSVDRAMLLDAIKEVAAEVSAQTVDSSNARNKLPALREKAQEGTACVFEAPSKKLTTMPELMFSTEYFLLFIQDVVLRYVDRHVADRRASAILDQLEPTSPAVADLTIGPRQEEETIGGRGRVIY